MGCVNLQGTLYSENLTILAPEKHKYGAKSDKKG